MKEKSTFSDFVSVFLLAIFFGEGVYVSRLRAEVGYWMWVVVLKKAHYLSFSELGISLGRAGCPCSALPRLCWLRPKPLSGDFELGHYTAAFGIACCQHMSHEKYSSTPLSLHNDTVQHTSLLLSPCHAEFIHSEVQPII